MSLTEEKNNFRAFWLKVKNFVTERYDDDIADLNAATFPLVVGWGTNNAGTYEVGTEVTPTATATATRKSSNVADSASFKNVSSGWGTSGLVATYSKKSEGSLELVATITQGGQEKTTEKLNWAWTYYRYMGVLNSAPAQGANYADIIYNLSTRELSTSATLGSTSLSAGKYYLFAVKGTATLVCRHASTDAVIASTKGTTDVPRRNGKGAVTYSWILVPKSESNWNFKITNA